MTDSAQVGPADLDKNAKPTAMPRDEMTLDERLFRYTYNTIDQDLHVLEFRILHRMNIFRLQNKLPAFKGLAWARGQLSLAEQEELSKTLHAYAIAVQDYTSMQHLQDMPREKAAKRKRRLLEAFPEIGFMASEPFRTRYRTITLDQGLSLDPLRRLLNRVLPRKLTYTKAELRLRMDEYADEEPPVSVSPLVDKVACFLVAFVGGASLVIPMLIMSLPRNTTKSLITVSIAVTLFAILLSVGVRASNTETLVATATYAAVLVVFVGTST